MNAPIPYFLFPRGHMLPYARQAKLVRPPQIYNRTLPICRNASASAPKPIVLEKPTRFNPPSHGKRLKQKSPRQYGPQLTGEQLTEQRTKKYPNMFPPEGSFMHWFLTNRSIHTYITISTLALLAAITAFENWRLATSFRDQLPSFFEFLSHPLTGFWQVIEVYKMENAKSDAAMNEKRRRHVEDVQKRSTYRIAHGLEDPNSQGLGGWTARSDEETLGPGAKAYRVVEKPVGVEPGQVEDQVIVESEETKVGPPKNYERRKVKKWLGIW